MLRSWSFLLISLATAAQAAPPARLEIAYELTRDGSPLASIVQTLEHGAGKYQLTEAWRGRGVFRLWGNIKRSSSGTVSADGLRPLQYSDERTGRDTERAKFDWSAKTVTIQYDGPEKTMPMPAHPSDDLAFLFEFAFNPPREEQIAVDVINGRGISDRIYRNEGRARLKTPAGEFDALKLVRRKEGNERAEIWLAADRGYLPVRILIIAKDGTRLDQVATRISAP